MLIQVEAILKLGEIDEGGENNEGVKFSGVKLSCTLSRGWQPKLLRLIVVFNPGTVQSNWGCRSWS